MMCSSSVVLFLTIGIAAIRFKKSSESEYALPALSSHSLAKDVYLSESLSDSQSESSNSLVSNLESEESF